MTDGKSAGRLAILQYGQSGPRSSPTDFFSEYLHHEDETLKAIRCGLYFTCDKASIDKEGYFLVSSRRMM